MANSFVKPSFEKSQVKDLHMRWRYTMMAMERCSSGLAPFCRRLRSASGWFLLFNYHCGTAKFDVEIFDGT
jgi:hypothetical protein